MYEVIVFGGTTEGRRLAIQIDRYKIRALVCVATEYGESLVDTTQNVDIHTGCLDACDMELLITKHSPKYIIDATHPYAEIVSKNAQNAADRTNTKYIRIKRSQSLIDNCIYCNDIEEAVQFANSVDGNVFAAIGAKSANALTAITDYKRRAFMRILPMPEGLKSCLESGFSPSNIICMQGPFSTEINIAMFRATNAKVLITKDSGRVGGFEEKTEAARLLNMKILVLKRPENKSGISIEDAITTIRGGLK